MDIQQPNQGYSHGQTFLTGNIGKYDSDSKEYTEVPETVSFSEHFYFSGSKTRSDEEISLQWQWSQAEH